MNPDSLENVCREIARKQYTPPGPKRVRDAMAQLFARKGYGRIIENESFVQLWNETVGDRFAKLTRPGVVRRGVLEVIVKSSAVTQELTFQKKSILKKLSAAGEKVLDLRFRVGET